VFGLLLKNRNNLLLHAQSTLDIPIIYAPNCMRRQEASCIVNTNPCDGHEGITTNNDVKWTYEIDGVPVCMPVRNANAPVIECRARERVDEKIEVTFTGVDGGPDRSNYTALLKSLSPIHMLGNYIPPPSPDVGADYEEFSENLEYYLESSNPEIEEEISRSVAVQMKRQLRHKVSKMVSVLFEVIFASSKTFSHLVHLIITSSRRGVWKYPLRFTSTEPISDDVIVIRSTGLNKESRVAFRLNSQSK